MSLNQSGPLCLAPVTSADGASASALLELAIQEGRKAADCQWELWKLADCRIQFLIGLAASMVTLGLAFGLGRLAPGSPEHFLLMVATGALVGAVLYLVTAYQADRFVRGARPLGVRSAAEDSPEAARRLIVPRLASAYQLNERALNRKLRRSRRGFLLLVLGGLAGLAAVAHPTSALE